MNLLHLLRRRKKDVDPELEDFRRLLTVPGTFEEGFNLSSFLGTLFVALIMVPGALYMELVAGAGIGGAAQWVTVLLFVEVAKRANAKLSRAQIFILFYMSGMIMGRSVYGTPLFTQFLFQSDAAAATGIAQDAPTWIVPRHVAYLPRTFLSRAWLPFLGLFVFREFFSRIDNAVLGYGLFRVTSDIERLPFPMAPVGAQGILAVAEQVEGAAKSSGTNVRWRMFCIGAGIGMVFGLVFMALPTITGAVFNRPLMVFKIPFADFTTYTEKFLPSVATGLSFDLGNFITGMVLPFFSMLGSFIGLMLTFIMNPILFKYGVMRSWEPGQSTVQTIFSNNIDFYFSFQIGISLAIAFYGIYVAFSTMARSKRNKKFATELHEQMEDVKELSRRRGHVPLPLVFATYAVTSSCYILLCGILIHWDIRVMAVLFFFAYLYTPLISYVTARLEGLAGQVIAIPFIRELSFILSGYQGIAIWFLPIPMANYGGQVVNYKQAELLGCKFTSIWKAQVLLFPIIIVATIGFSDFIWGLAKIPSTIYPYTMEMWELGAKNACLLYSSTLGEYSQFQEALGWGRFLGGLFSASAMMFVLGWFGAPTMLFFGMVRGLGQTIPHSVIPNMIGALVGKFYFERKYGREWRKMIPVVSAGFFVGTGLISILSVGVVFLSKAISSASY